jgi:hypothetical protein
MKSTILLATTALLALGLVSAGPALSQENNYRSWNGYQQHSTDKKYQTWGGYQSQSDTSVAQFITRVRGLVNDATEARAADPVFLADLVALMDQYSPQGGKGHVFLSDNFRDGNYTANPVWKVTAGQWSIDSDGNNVGLASRVSQNQGANQGQQIDQLLGAVLGYQTQTSTRRDFARIQTAVSFTNAFVIKVKLSSEDIYGGFNVVPYKGTGNQSAYRLLYRPSNAKGLVLHRVSGNQVTEIGAYNGTVRLEDGRVHELVWTRNASGQMLVTVDGQNAIKSTDTNVTGNMDGLVLANVGGSYWIREVKIEGN